MELLISVVSRVPVTPCSGLKMASSETPGACASASVMCVNDASTDAGLLTMPTRRPRKAPDASNSVDPRVTDTPKL